ncbi:hypothetical protein B0A58_07325 [Flavobacterium branchiophilum NBRC 15030 = ATCC 35035]|uniref:Uncharacterized protein n=1 Tax=Flavobacterium branchiophilum TaxID=55197 RepID=A0A543G137_9FLAO|nr:hypothetical protein [Flavobacterium branchiophilum]OXA76376.1 hypothetical protein B0A58_07325 [Flavobacterium branchiophilum NBRC 15030 = ATCC 35035]TQM39802.1 hypothetical protein BC670_0633 [Flavobacterium branchiophilum]GEM55264.1 hypothetical protein FB1_14850 [Flavobacterium branchiophilum NBRC 15030 = ATCC 35035]
MKTLKPEIRSILDKIKGVNADEDFVKSEVEKRNLKKEIHRSNYEISYDILGRCFISAHLSTKSSTAEIAVMKWLLTCDLLIDENYIEE